jgi:hypothetical protein
VRAGERRRRRLVRWKRGAGWNVNRRAVAPVSRSSTLVGAQASQAGPGRDEGPGAGASPVSLCSGQARRRRACARPSQRFVLENGQNVRRKRESPAGRTSWEGRSSLLQEATAYHRAAHRLLFPVAASVVRAPE